VQGVLGAVGSLAAQLAHWGGATVIGTVTRASDLDRVDTSVAPVYPLAKVAAAHDHVDNGPRNGRIVVAIPNSKSDE
jgi:NADPH2:quinone reductase